MPVGFLTAEQVRRYGRMMGDPSPEQLARHSHLDDTDRAFVGEHHGDHNRLGVAVQLGAVRLTGAFIDDFAAVPSVAIRYAADQLDIGGQDRSGSATLAATMAAYAAAEWRWRHAGRIRERYDYRQFSDFGIAFRLNRFLYAPCWTGTERPSVPFDRAIAWLVAAKVLLPVLTVLEGSVARVRSRAADHLLRTLIARLAPEQRNRLDTFVTVPEAARKSPLDRLRDGPILQSGPEIIRAVARLNEVRAIGSNLPAIDCLPPGRIAALARFATAAKAQAVARLPDDRRHATLLAFVHVLEA